MGVGDGSFGVVCQARIHLEADEAVAAVTLEIDGPQDVCCGLDVSNGQFLEDGLGRSITVGGEHFVDLPVVGVRRGYCVLEDARVAGDSPHPVLDEADETAFAAEHVPADEVDPGRLAGIR